MGKQTRNYKNPKYSIDLVKTFDRAYSDKSREFRSKLKPILKQSRFRELYARNVIERIQDRTKEGIDRHGSTFIRYKDSYKKTDIFKIYGKSSKVNLTLTGEMLASLESQRKAGNSIVFEFVGLDSDNAAKAYGHITGMDGHPWLDGVTPARDFFGIPDEDEEEIMVETMKTFRRLSSIEEEELASAISLGVSGLRITAEEI